MKGFVHSGFFFSGTYSLHVSGHGVLTANILPKAKPSQAPQTHFICLLFMSKGPGSDNDLILTLKLTRVWKWGRKYWELALWWWVLPHGRQKLMWRGHCGGQIPEPPWPASVWHLACWHRGHSGSLRNIRVFLTTTWLRLHQPCAPAVNRFWNSWRQIIASAFFFLALSTALLSSLDWWGCGKFQSEEVLFISSPYSAELYQKEKGKKVFLPSTAKKKKIKLVWLL